MACSHKWDCGCVVWFEDIPKIKAECLICKEPIIVEFGTSVYFNDDNTSIQEMLIKDKRRRR